MNKCISIDKSLTGLNDFYEISNAGVQKYHYQRTAEASQQDNDLPPCLASEILGRANANHVISNENWSNLEEFKSYVSKELLITRD